MPYECGGAYSCRFAAPFFPGSKEPYHHCHNNEGACSKNNINYCFDISQGLIRGALGLRVFHGGILDVDRWLWITFDVVNFKSAFLAFRNTLELIGEMVKSFDCAYRASFFCHSSASRGGYIECAATQRLLNINFHGFYGVICFNQVVKFLPFHFYVKPWRMKAKIKIWI